MTLMPQTVVQYTNESDYELTGSDLTSYITYRARFFCDIMIHRTTERVFSRQTFLRPMFHYWWQSALFLLIHSYFFQNIKSSVKNWEWSLKRKPMEANISSISLGLRFRRDSRFQRFIPYLNVVGSYCFLFRRCCWSVYLRKKLTCIKH